MILPTNAHPRSSPRIRLFIALGLILAAAAAVFALYARSYPMQDNYRAAGAV